MCDFRAFHVWLKASACTWAGCGGQGESDRAKAGQLRLQAKASAIRSWCKCVVLHRAILPQYCCCIAGVPLPHLCDVLQQQVDHPR